MVVCDNENRVGEVPIKAIDKVVNFHIFIKFQCQQNVRTCKTWFPPRQGIEPWSPA